MHLGTVLKYTVVLDEDLRREGFAIHSYDTDQRMIWMLEKLMLGAYDHVLVLQTNSVGLPGLPPFVKFFKGLLFPIFGRFPNDRLGRASFWVRGTGLVLLRALVPIDRPEPPAVKE